MISVPVARAIPRTHLPLCADPRRLAMRRHVSSSSVRLEYDILHPEKSVGGPLIILHGLFGSKRNWLSLSKAFCRDLQRPIYSLDLRNHGTSPHARPHTYNAMAEDVLQFCEEHSLEDAVVLGHSMGGKVAMSLALHPSLPPPLLSKLIVADIAPSRNALSPEFQSYVRAMQDIEQARVPSRKEAQRILAETEKDAMVRAFLLTNLDTASEAEGAMRFKVPLDILSEAIPELGSFPYAPGERTWEGPTLFIKGTKSKYINHKNIPVARTFFPNMELKELDASHWVHAEQSAGFLKLVTEFVKRG